VQFCRGREDITFGDALELTFPEHMHRLIALDGSPGRIERPEPEPWIDTAFHKAMILFHHIV
jgi:hypothetical protein